MADEYDEALQYLREQDRKAGRGTYFEAIAGLIEKLLGRVWELETKYEPKPDPVDAAWEAEKARRQKAVGAQLTARSVFAAHKRRGGKADA